MGICGEGESSSFTHRLGGHLGTATQTCQENTVKPVGRHFRLPGHDPHRDLLMLPIEIVSARDPFLLRSRERYNIWNLFISQIAQSMVHASVVEASCVGRGGSKVIMQSP